MKGHGDWSFTPKIRKIAKAEVPNVKVAMEEIRVHQMTKAPMMMTIPPTSGEIARVVAAAVMPPAPPLKPLRKDQLWPMMAKPPTKATDRFSTRSRIDASSGVMAPGSGKSTP
jgi:hypothetical protein